MQVDVHAQSLAGKSGVTFRKMFLDYQSQNGGNISNFGNYRQGYELGYTRRFTDKFGLSIPLRYGVVDTHREDINDLRKRIFSGDVQLQYHFYADGRKFIPYLLAGAGGVMETEGETNVQFPVGFGFNIRIAPRAAIVWQSEYRKSLKDGRDNLQHGVGFNYYFGVSPKDMEEKIAEKLDTDMDGTPDEMDLCPTEFGAKELNGCPDSDGDMVANYLDKCPDVKGLAKFDGCPDTDGDGIPDAKDDCPTVAGTEINRGCPEVIVKEKDTDGDGVPDTKDLCPDQKGTAANDGCPDTDGDGIPDKTDKCPTKPGLAIYGGCPDTDGDGIDDSRDKCPNLAGTVANEGCPELKIEDKKTLEVAMQAVQFQTGSAVLKPESNIVLNQIADILRKYPDFNMAISGHTDNTGNSVINQSLSDKRAKACYDYIIKQKIDSSRLSYAGYGESRPISTNDNEKGRTLNRRVEFNMVPRE